MCKFSNFIRGIPFLLAISLNAASWSNQLARLPLRETDKQPRTDWLLDDRPFQARAFRVGDADELALDNGLVRRTFRLTPNGATVGLDQLTSGQAVIRGVKPEALLRLNGVDYAVGGLVGQPNYAYLLPEWKEHLQSDPAAFQLRAIELGPTLERFAWKQTRHHAPDLIWPPTGIHLRMDYEQDSLPGLRVSVHYELYDGLPCFSKWLTLSNGTGQTLTLDHFTSELLAAVEADSVVDNRGVSLPTPNIHVETDYAMGGMQTRDSGRYAVHWVEDPDYRSQVNFMRQTPCLLRVEPTLGPEQEIAPGTSFESFHTFVLPFDSEERERNGLAQRRLYRKLAPWTTENPIMMHVRHADWETVRRAIDQCAETGFEMVILTFGSGFNIENDQEEYLSSLAHFADYAHQKNVEIGGYSLLASRQVGGGNDVVMPPGGTPIFGNSPCLESAWGRHYFAKLDHFFTTTGFTLLEHDGSYPGDICAATNHPGHHGLADSQWTQWRRITDFYKWARARGIYLNVPDYYYLAGSSKCGMGYREDNWSLPRAQQVIHTRQNIYDGTWTKTPSMGWMFVPLTEYGGGGAAATIEPLDEHRDHYERMLMSNLALGVQACYRGPRLYDTPATREVVQRCVSWFKRYREILESDLIHGRRADGRDVDWMLHVNPRSDPCGLLVAFNPLPHPAERVLHPNLYYTGASKAVRIRRGEESEKVYPVASDHTVDLPVTIEPYGTAYFVIEGR